MRVSDAPAAVVAMRMEKSTTREPKENSGDANGGSAGQDGVLTDLNDLVPADSPLVFTDPSDINSRGQIVGLSFQKSTGDMHAFLLTPSNSEVAGDSAAIATPGNISERPKVVLPENVRELLQHEIVRGRHARLR
jgi:hypothetical protein